MLSVIKVLLIWSGIETNPGPPQLLTQNLRIAHNNECSLFSKLDVVSTELSDFDILAITETHLDNTVKDDDLLITGYHTPIRKDRNRFGGCVTLYISKNSHFSVRNDLDSKYMEIL